MSDVILDIQKLVVSFDTEQGRAKAVDGVSFQLKKGQSLGIVGESGCGKSVTALSIMRLLPKPAGQILSGSILFKGKDIAKLNKDELHSVRGNRISMIFQEPMTALNPVQTVYKQIGEVFELHFPSMSTQEKYNACLELLQKVGIPEPAQRLHEFPHQLSGGMRQRVMIAMALACKPDILIADEPTTALDVTIQAQILDLMRGLQKEFGTAIVFITHDLGVIAELCDEVVVMYAGRVAEHANVHDIFSSPKHPYTKGLLESIPRMDGQRKTMLNLIPGMVPSLFDFPKGCRFQNRCKYVQEKCKESLPEEENVGENHTASCFRWKEI